MKRKGFFLSILLVSFALSCGNRVVCEPGEVAVELFNSLTSGEAEIVKRNIYFADEVEREFFGEYLDEAVASSDFAERTKGYTADYKVLSQSIQGDSAFVELRGVTVLGEMTRFNVLLVKVDGEWKVDGRFSVLQRN